MTDNDQDDTPLVATLNLTRHQWKCLLCHVRNDIELARVGLAPQIGRESFAIMDGTANAILSEVTRATGISEQEAEA